jgi:hypothetical protein
MTPSDKADKAISILELVDRNVRHALKTRAYFCRAAYQDDVKNYFNQTKGAPGYNQIVDSLYFELIITLVRLFDELREQKHADNFASLPELISLLRQSAVIDVLQERSLQAKTPTGELEKDLKSHDQGFLSKLRRDAIFGSQQETAVVFALLAEFQKLKGSHLLARLRLVRNELFAHTALERSQNNPVRYGDAEDLLKQTATFISQLNDSVRRLHCDYTDHERTWTEHADVFWQMVLKSST